MIFAAVGRAMARTMARTFRIVMTIQEASVNPRPYEQNSVLATEL